MIASDVNCAADGFKALFRHGVLAFPAGAQPLP
jgi:hypothetical protein